MSKKVNKSYCPHVNSVGVNSWEDVERKRQQETCDSCNAEGNLWLCMQNRCLYVGCGERAVDHSLAHAEVERHHLAINLQTMRIYCNTCEVEVYKDRNSPALIMRERSVISPHGVPTPEVSLQSYPASPSHFSLSDSSDSEDDDDPRPRGLTGLQNQGNTCYMNAALQALSNCHPLTRYFRDCKNFVRPNKKSSLSKSYLDLIYHVWHRDRYNYYRPNDIVQGIKGVHTIFKGFSQQDTQEFLRCFMDQLHEELKQPTECSDDDDEEEEGELCYEIGMKEVEDVGQEMELSVEPAGQSDTEYETCDSGLNSENSSMERSVSSEEEINERLQKIDEQIENKMEQSAESQVQFDNTEEQNNEVGRVQSSPKPRRSLRIKNQNLNNSQQIISSPTPKELKDSANFAKAHIGEERPQNDDSEFMDARSDLDPVITQKPVSRSPCHISKRTQPTNPVHAQKPAVKPQSSPKKKKKAVQYTSVISDIFDGNILSSVQCLTCERVSSTIETFQDLSLPIPSRDHLYMLHNSKGYPGQAKTGACGEVNNQSLLSWAFSWLTSWFWGPAISLQDCLAAFFSNDELKGDNMYSCEKCKKLRNGIKYSRVTKLPEILCIHLKRFRHEFMFSSKISSKVVFPLDGLDMKKYLHKDCHDQVSVYDLVSVICHHGTAGGGHYTAYCLNHIDNNWYEFDDQSVTEVDFHTVENCEAYVLFYRKRDDHMMDQRMAAKEMMENKKESLMTFSVSKQWVNRFNTFAEPGPITNHDFLCKHGGVPPDKFDIVSGLVCEVPESLWEYFHSRYGGGPACNHLYLCTICQQELEKIKKKQNYELDTFKKLYNDMLEEENPRIIYALSREWRKKWVNFAEAKENEPPGPIDNSKICTTSKTGQLTVKPGYEYIPISEDMWNFFIEIYGGGPELVVCLNTTVPQSPQKTQSAQGEEQSQDSRH